MSFFYELNVRKSLALCATQLAGGLFLEILMKYFEVTLNIFEFSHVQKIVESFLVYADKF